MDACRNCGARLAPGAEWCGQCYAPVEQGPLPEPVPEAPARTRADQRSREQLPEPVYSRWRGGPNSLSPAAKVVLTVIILAFAPVGGFYGFQVLYLVSYIPIAGLLLWGIWRKERVE